jgi:hypothetical protein
MTDERTSEDKTEQILKSIVLPPAPPGLRERVLRAAREERQARAWTTPRLRVVLAVCAGLMICALGGDAIASRRQTLQIRALLGGTQAPWTESSRDLAELAAELGGPLDARLLALLENWGSSSKGTPRTVREDLDLELRQEVF